MAYMLRCQEKNVFKYTHQSDISIGNTVRKQFGVVLLIMLYIITWLVGLLALSKPNSLNTCRSCMYLNLMSTVSMGPYIVTVSTCKLRVLHLETTCCTVVVTFTI